MSPRKDPLEPVKENIGRGTGMGTLTPTCRGKIRNIFQDVRYPNLECVFVKFLTNANEKHELQ